MHIYCVRCERHFSSIDARQSHWDNSSAHHICGVCGFDGVDDDELEDHFEESNCYYGACDGCDHWFLTSHSLDQHFKAVVACEECDYHCHTQSRRKQHMADCHNERTIKCWGCLNKFVQASNMISHLESGACTSGCSSEDINYKLMVKCTNLRQFVKPKYRQVFRQGAKDGKVDTEELPFACEDCGDSFPLLSSLCQHMESSKTCDRRLSEVSLSPMQREFEKKVLKRAT
ncbi:hypothetical protein SLS58_002491 [Diplodia intermedia]|uniref:C2H2-type domain-containing protein n=1 Tax=Diplodia intermedia TaxID=856260 RepID=A0ABR3TYK8_9PEZI